MILKKNYMREDDNGLRDIITLIKPNSVMVEIGCFTGESTIIFAKSSKIRKLYAVDPWIENYDPDIKLQITFSKAKEIFDEKLKDFTNIEVMQMTSAEASSAFLDNSVDIVYIDGDHRYEFVKKDIECWLPKLKKDGIIAGHDIVLTGVMKAVCENFEKPKNVFSDGSWLVELGE